VVGDHEIPVGPLEMAGTKGRDSGSDHLKKRFSVQPFTRILVSPERPEGLAVAFPMHEQRGPPPSPGIDDLKFESRLRGSIPDPHHQNKVRDTRLPTGFPSVLLTPLHEEGTEAQDRWNARLDRVLDEPANPEEMTAFALVCPAVEITSLQRCDPVFSEEFVGPFDEVLALDPVSPPSGAGRIN
jgi:hypothetical protein